MWVYKIKKQKLKFNLDGCIYKDKNYNGGASAFSSQKPSV